MDTPLVEQVRSFNRTMTERVGALNDHFLGRYHPLGEARLLWEIGAEGARVRDLRSRLGL
ncbi:MAG: MarR family transcriptional regulator, partial [Ktedonobacterales bacterium]